MPIPAIKAFLARRREHRKQLARRADPIGTFIAERTRPHDGSQVQSPLIFEAFCRWSRANGFEVYASPRALHLRLVKAGYRKRVGNGIFWIDIDLLVEETR